MIIMLCLVSMVGSAQDNNRTEKKLTVPLSSPGERGRLTVDILSGSITVQSYNGKEVIVTAITQGRNDKSRKANNGMFKIPNNSYGLEIQERNNHVEVETEAGNKRVDIEVLLPQNFDLDLNTVNGGDITVSGIHGELEISNVNGSITLNDVEGNVLANTVNGRIIATVNKVTPDVPLSFTTLNGKIDVTLPKGFKATAKIQSDYGEIYSDYDLAIEEQPVKVKSSDSGHYKKIEVGRWVVGRINGGGPELRLKNMHGNIYIRSTK